MYIYGNGDWGDQLTNYNGYSLTYDVMGNPTSYYNGSRMNMSWGHSGVLKALTFGSTTVGYTYNDGGVRTSKTVNGVLHSYSLDGSVIMSESFADKLLIYLYDEFGTPFGIKYRESDYALGEFDCYIFEKNLHGDIIGIFSEAGARVASYEYDAWGNCVNMTYASGYGVICNLNPFRYRSYYYDTETGFYYCGSRYYDPSLGRFISADSVGTVTLTPMSYTDKNLYAYCDNNPVMRTDNGGEFWDTFFDVVSLCASVIDVVKNPDDPWAWVGLAADVVSVAVPFATGGGAVVDAVTSVDEVAGLAKNVDRTFEGVDTVSDLGKTTERVIDGVKIQNATDFTPEAKKIIDSLDHSGGITRSTGPKGTQIHTGYKVGEIGKEYDKIVGCRMDCLDEVNKIIYELKPNNPRSISQGIKQLKRYNEALGGGYTLILELY